MQAVSTSPYHLTMARKYNVWYSIADGNWGDSTTWISNGAKRHSIPQPGDTVYLNHAVSCNVTISLNNLYISGSLKFDSSSRIVTVNGDLQASGIVDQSAGSNTIILNGYNNSITTFTPGSSSIIQYSARQNQYVMPLAYSILKISSGGIKYLAGDLTVNGTLNVDSNAVLELGSFNSTINVTNLTGALTKASSTGIVNFNNTISSIVSTGSVNFSGSPTVNFSCDITGDFRSGINFGSGTLNVLTSQTWSVSTSGNVPLAICTNGTILIASGKTLTNSGLSPLLINGTTSINGVDGTSVLNINTGYAYGNTNTPMTTGVFNYNNSGTSSIYLQSGVTMTLPFTSFFVLMINGAGTLSGNTTINNDLNIGSGGSLQLASYDFTCSGAFTYLGSISKSGGGTVNFSTISSTASTGSINFLGSPTVNLSGNIVGDVRSGFNFGSGTVNVISNISVGVNVSGNNAVSIGWNIVIGSGKTLTNIGLSSTTGGLITTGTITGIDSTASFDNRSMFTYNNATAPMATGKLFCNQAINTFIYGLVGDQDIAVPLDATPGYKNLTLQGSGIKRLLGNVSVKGTYTLTSPATLNSNGFSLTNP